MWVSREMSNATLLRMQWESRWSYGQYRIMACAPSRNRSQCLKVRSAKHSKNKQLQCFESVLRGK